MQSNKLVRRVPSNRQQIIQDAKQRDIVNFVHITNVENLPSILLNGICSKAYLEDNNIEYDCADAKQINRIEDAISISVTFPNYKMFYSLRQENEKVEWVVLLLDAKQVLSLDCAFCYTNASSNEIFNIPLELRKTYEAFEQMFLRIGHEKYRGLSPNEPTDPQAEILVFNLIPASFIKKVIFEKYEVKIKYASLLNKMSIPYNIDERYFLPRHDYSFWQ